MKPTLVFFGSFLDYSTQILHTLHQSNQVEVIGVVTTPPMPVGRRQTLTKTPVHLYAESIHLPVFTPSPLPPSPPFKGETFKGGIKPDLFLTAGYGKLLPPDWLSYPRLAALNIHFSLLPKYRGAMPAEWAILCGESQTGVTLIEMNQDLDAGHIIGQATIPITPTDTRETLYQQLYPLGAKLFLASLPSYLNWKNQGTTNFHTAGQLDHFKLILPPEPQRASAAPYAKLLSKDDAFIPWSVFHKAQSGQNITSPDLPSFLRQFISASSKQSSAIYHLLERSVRALHGYPNVWTIVSTPKGSKRLKILCAHTNNNRLILDQVQLEGLSPTSFNQIKNQLLL